ncbi:MAG: TonB family protein [Phycisphaerales bacterium]|nr:TonB family protein [Hyphomonadaceae bacterium]
MRLVLAAAVATLAMCGLTYAQAPQSEMLYPRAALQEGIGGNVLVDCAVMADGGVACSVLSEEPSGRGFGDAVLTMSESWRMPTMDESGAPTAGRRVRRAIEFLPGPPPTVREPVNDGRVTNPYWAERPTARDFERHYPREALRRGVSGAAMLECIVNADGSLVCYVDEETPEGHGFGQAALRIAESFRIAPATRDGVPTSGGRVRVPIRFNTY